MASGASDNAFLAEQYRLCAERVFRRCLAMCGGNCAWAEDATQDVFIRLVENGPEQHSPQALVSWLLTVADRLCVDRLRREHGVWNKVKKALALGAEDAVWADTAVPHPPSESLLAQLRLSLSELPRKEHEAVVMKYIEGRKQTDIAAQMRCSEGYVSKLLGRAVATLRTRGWEVADD